MTRAISTPTLIFFLVLAVLARDIEAKKKRPNTLLAATKQVSMFLDDVSEFFEDIVDTIGSLFDFGKDPIKKVKKTLDIDQFMAYASKTMKSGVKMITDAIPLINLARSTVDDVGPFLPNTTMAHFVKIIIRNLLPEVQKDSPRTMRNF